MEITDEHKKQILDIIKRTVQRYNEGGRTVYKNPCILYVASYNEFLLGDISYSCKSAVPVFDLKEILSLKCVEALFDFDAIEKNISDFPGLNKTWY